MTFPVVESVTETQFTSATTSYACDLPATVSSGDLLLLIISKQSLSSGSLNTPSGWTQKYNDTSGVRCACFVKVSDGTEGGGTVTVSSNQSNKAAAQVLRISGWYGTLTGVDHTLSSSGFGGGTSVDPPSHSPAWGSADNLWLAVMHCQSSGNNVASVSSYPSGYSGGTDTLGATAGSPGCTVAHAYKNAAASSENPGTFSISTFQNYAGVTIAIRPTAGDTTPPTLTSATGTATGTTTADLSVSTNEANGTLYTVVTESATAPSKAQVKAGQDHTGSAAVFDDSQAISTTGSKSFSATGLTASTTYYAHFMHEDAATNQSSVVTSSSFTTSASGTGTAFNSANWSGYDEQSATNPTSALTDFTLLIDVSDLSATWKSNVQSDGADIRITKGDGTTELAYDLIDWAYNAGSPTGWIRCKWSGTLASSGTQNVRVWAGYTGGTATAYGASETYGSNNAYDSNTEGYWPLHDFNDRTANANHLTGNGGVTAGGATGKVGDATDFDGTDDYATDDDGESYLNGQSAITLSAWIKADASGVDSDIFTGHPGVGNDSHVGFRYDVAGASGGQSNVIKFAVETTGGTQTAESSASKQTTNWQHLVMTWASGSNIELYINGGLDTPSARDSSVSGTVTAQTSFNVGRDFRSSKWSGLIDEVRVDGVSRSAAWVKEEYDQTNDNATFWGTWAWTSTGGSSVSATLATLEIAPLSASVSVGTTIQSGLATLEVSPLAASVSVGTTIAATTATVEVAGLAASVSVGTTVSATLATAEIAPLAASISVGTTIQSTLATIQISPLTASVSAGTTINATLATVELAGLSVGVSVGTTITATTATAEISGLSASVDNTATINATLGTMQVSGLAASVSAGTTIQATTATVDAAGLSANISSGTTIQSTLATVDVSPLTASVSVGTTIQATLATVEVTGLAVSVSVGATIDATLATLEVTAFAASVSNAVAFTGFIYVTGEQMLKSTVTDEQMLKPSVTGEQMLKPSVTGEIMIHGN